MSFITLAFPAANLNKNNKMEANKCMPALFVHTHEVGKPSSGGVHLLLKVRCWVWQSFTFCTCKCNVEFLSSDTQVSYWYSSLFATFPAESRLISYIIFYHSNCWSQGSSIVIRDMWNGSVFEIALYCQIYSRIIAMQITLMCVLSNFFTLAHTKIWPFLIKHRKYWTLYFFNDQTSTQNKIS